MTKGKSVGVTFEVLFEDGTTDWIEIDQSSLRTGDHIARIVAGEWQRDGRLPDKPIKAVKRSYR